MFKNYLKTTFRFLVRNKTFSIINILGLSIGTLCCLYIVLYVADQYSYDKHYKEAASIYRVDSDIKMPGQRVSSATSSPPIVPAMKNDFGEVSQFARVVTPDGFGVRQHLLKYKDKSFYETDADYVDSTFTILR